MQLLTFLQDKSARMIKQKVSKVVTVGINAGFLAQAGRTEELERLKRLQGRLALGYCYCTAGNCVYKENFSVKKDIV